MRREEVLAQWQREYDSFLQDCMNRDWAKIVRADEPNREVAIMFGADKSFINNVKSLLFAIEHRLYDVLQLLLDKGADPNSRVKCFNYNNRSIGNTTPLIEAIKINDLESIKILLDNGADINFCAERNLSDRDVYFNKARIRVKEPSDDLYIKPREKRTDDEKMYIWKYNTGELANVSPIQIAYNYHHDSIVDYLLSRGATMKVGIRPTGIFPFPFTTLDEMLRRCKLYFIKQVGLCEEQYSALRTQVREFESTKELLRDWETSNSAPYPRLFIPATQLLPDISHEFKSQYIALCSLFILEYWNATINSKTHIAAMADVDDIGYKICHIILWREIYSSHR
ncbi:MAG: ankyrin repeat domain-containing protein [Bacteroides ovatus]